MSNPFRIKVKGYTITEIAVIIAVFAVAMVPLLALFLTGISETEQTINRSVAVELGAEALEILKARAYNDLLSADSHDLPALGLFDVLYDRQVYVTEKIEGQMLELKAEVTWKEKNVEKKIALRTFVSNPWVILK